MCFEVLLRLGLGTKIAACPHGWVAITMSENCELSGLKVDVIDGEGSVVLLIIFVSVLATEGGKFVLNGAHVYSC